jgi:two-component system phosphate regulon response regulator OmpR
MRVLVVEDHEVLARTLGTGLRREGMAVDVVRDGDDALEHLAVTRYDVVVLDRDLPGVHGDDVCRRLVAQRSPTRVLMLTAASTVKERVTGLSLGADDYLPKPFEPRELLARLRAILRRKSSAAAPQDIKRFGRLEIDRAGRRVTIDGEECPLTSYQYALLDALAGNAGRVMSRDALMDLTKGEQLEAFDRSVDVHISRIRAAIEDDPKKPRRIITIRGAGYVFAKEQDRA